MKLVDRKTGALVEVPDDKVGAAFQSGMFGLPKGASLPMRVPGVIGTVSGADAAQAISQGETVASPKEVHDTAMENRYGGIPGIAGAGAAGVARGVGENFGVPVDAMGTDLADLFSGDIMHGGDSLRERLKAYQELHPIASTGGELAGLVGGAVATGGEGLLAKAGGLAEHLAPEALGKIGTGLARGGTEGGLIGGISAVNESALGDPNLTGEKLVAGIGHGAFLGGALGGAFHGLGVVSNQAREATGRYIAKLAPKDIEVLAERTFGTAPEGLGQKVQRYFSRASSAFSGKDADVISKFTDLSPEGAEARRIAVYDAPQIQENAERGIRTHIDNMMQAGDLVSAEARGQLKTEYVDKAVKRGNEAETLGATREQIQTLVDGVERQLAHPDGVAPSMIKPLKSAHTMLERMVGVLEEQKTTGHVPFIDPDAGLSDELTRLPKPFHIGEDLRPMVMAGGGRADRIATAEMPSLVTRAKYPAPDAGLTRVGENLDFDAGLEPHTGKVENAFRPSAAEKVPRAIDVSENIHAEKAPKGEKAIKYEAQKAPNTDNARVFVELDQMKRALQKISSTGERSVHNITDPLDQINAKRTLGWFKGAANDLRGTLEREDLFGKAATDQRTINAAWTKQIDASKRFHKALTTEVGRDPNDPYRNVRGADPSKVGTYVRNLVNPANDLTHQAVKDYVAETKNLAGAIESSYHLPPEKIAEVQRVKASAEGFGSEISKAEKSLVLANQYEALTKGSSDSLAGLASAVGFAAGGLPGGAIGTAIGSLAHPGKVIAQLAAVERMVTKVDARMGSSLRSFFKGRRAPAPELHEVATPEGFDKTVKLLARAVDPDGNVTPAGMAQIANAVGDLGSGAPKIAAAATGTMMRVLTFLATKLPPGMHDPHDMFPGEHSALVSDTERETFARYFEAATDPPSVFEHLAHGSVTPEETEALKVCHPALYAEAGQSADRMIIEAAAAGKPLDYSKRIEIGVLFEKPTDPTLAHDFMATVAAGRTAPPPTAIGGGKKGGAGAGGFVRPAHNIAPRFMTTFEAASTSRRKGAI